MACKKSSQKFLRRTIMAGDETLTAQKKKAQRPSYARNAGACFGTGRVSLRRSVAWSVFGVR